MPKCQATRPVFHRVCQEERRWNAYIQKKTKCRRRCLKRCAYHGWYETRTHVRKTSNQLQLNKDGQSANEVHDKQQTLSYEMIQGKWRKHDSAKRHDPSQGRRTKPRGRTRRAARWLQRGGWQLHKVVGHAAKKTYQLSCRIDFRLIANNTR